jgi:Leu/Phe-tRNA-protein transferase
MFFVESGASKAAVLDLCRRLAEAGVQVLDTQQESDHLTAMGQVLVDRAEYVAVVRALQAEAAELPRGRRAVADLLEP